METLGLTTIHLRISDKITFSVNINKKVKNTSIGASIRHVQSLDLEILNQWKCLVYYLVQQSDISGYVWLLHQMNILEHQRDIFNRCNFSEGTKQPF